MLIGIFIVQISSILSISVKMCVLERCQVVKRCIFVKAVLFIKFKMMSLHRKCQYSAYSQVFFPLSPGSNLPNPTSWRAVPWLWLGDTVLKHIKALHLGTSRPQDVYFPVQGTRGVGSCPCPTSHFPTLSTQDLGYGPAHWEFGIRTSSLGIWDMDQLTFHPNLCPGI